MKNKILLSWIAIKNDFLIRNKKGEMSIPKDTLFNMEGPHINLYKHFPDFDIHYLFYSANSEKEEESGRFLRFAKYLEEESGKKVILKRMIISDVIDVSEIKGKMRDFIQEKFYNREIEIFINPGTPAMQTAWYLIGTELDNVKLFNIREARHTESQKKPEKRPIKIESSEYARTVNMIEVSRNRGGREPLKTKSYEDVYEKARKLGGNINSTVLIQGETGTGKEILAQHIHQHSARNRKKMVSINCAAYQGDLLESRLFGYEKGAFTGADQLTKGVFEKANGSTLFLDEIGDITPHMQVTLLRALQERKISRIGSVKEIEIDVRIVAATNKNLWEMCKKGDFRFDLFFRLAIAELTLPSFSFLPKMEKKKWIEYFLIAKQEDIGRKNTLELSKKVWNILLSHPFIGNIRELEAIIESFYVFCTEVDIVTEEFVIDRIAETDKDISPSLNSVIDIYMMKILKQCNGSVARSAKILGRNEGTVRTWKKNNYPIG